MPQIPEPLDRRTLLLLAAFTTVGLVFRFQGFETLSLSHFDEGIYVTSGMTVASGGPYSFGYSQPLQSPPLFPWMIGTLCWVFQALSPAFGILVVATLGAASVPLFFFLVRRSSGNRAALYAASLLATSDFHIAYSRMALTEVPLTFWFLCTMYCVTRLVEQFYSAPEASAAKRDHKRARPGSDRLRPAHFRLKAAAWTIGTGFCGGAAWNTKYNGWLIFAISLCAGGVFLLRQNWSDAASPEASPAAKSPGRAFLLCLILAVVAGGLTYLPWYGYVETQFPGGYRAVIENHRRYFAGPASWPENIVSMIASLAALRHWGWVATLALAGGWCVWRLRADRLRRFDADSPWTASRSVAKGLLVLALVAVAIVQGTDAVILVLALAAIPFACLKAEWGRLSAAVWSGTFLVLAPLYHPYPRLLLPALPACICLALWLLREMFSRPGASGRSIGGDGTVSNSERPLSRLAIGTAAVFGGVLLMSSHPFGLFPIPGVWNRWSAHQSYRAAEQAILKNTKPDAIVICQTQPIMMAYCHRERRIVENESFIALYDSLPADRDCFLVVDFCWLHRSESQLALQGLRDHARRLMPVAVIANDVNIVTLLDYLPPTTLVQKVSQLLPEYQFTVQGGGKIVVPPPLEAPFRDVIVLYRIEPAKPD